MSDIAHDAADFVPPAETEDVELYHPKTRELIEKGLAFLRDRRPLRTEEVCRDYLLEHPGCVDHLRLLAHALMKQGRAQEAEQQLRLALSIKNEFPQLHEDLGSALAMQSKCAL